MSERALTWARQADEISAIAKLALLDLAFTHAEGGRSFRVSVRHLGAFVGGGPGWALFALDELRNGDLIEWHAGERADDVLVVLRMPEAAEARP